MVTCSNFWLFMLIPALMLFVLLVIILLFSVRADFHSICGCSIYESVSEVVKSIIAAAREIDVVGKS